MKDGKARYKFGKNLKPFETGCLTGPRQKLCAWDNAQSKTLFNGLNKGNSFLYTDPGTGVSTFQNYIGAGAVRHLPARTAKEMSRPYGLARPPNAPSAAAPSNPGGIIAPPTERSGPPLRPMNGSTVPMRQRRGLSRSRTKRSSSLDPVIAPPVAVEAEALSVPAAPARP